VSKGKTPKQSEATIPRSVRLSPDAIRQLEEIGAKEDRSVSYLLQKAVAEFLEDRKMFPTKAK
jgi:predicted transcriptional regulator